MKILIICDIFPPAFGPRMGYLCKYLKRAGWEPVVLTEQIDDTTFSFLAENTDVTYVKFFRTKGRIIRKLEWILILLLDLLFHYKDKKMEKEATQLLNKGGYDGILCSTYRTFPLPAAVHVATKFNLPIIADLRDIVEQYAGNEFIANMPRTFTWLDNRIAASFRKRLLKDRNHALRAVNCVTTVSPWHVEIIKVINPETKLIYNGYDPEIFYPEQIRTSKFVITFTGRLISLATRNPQLLFEAIKELNDDKRITSEKIRIQWFTDAKSQDIIRQEVKKYQIESYMDYYNYIPASEIPGVLNKSSILLQLANLSSTTGPKGFMTTKLFEAFAVEKPILCVRNDEGCLEKTIIETNSGISAKTVSEVKDFILDKYKEWESKGYTTQHIVRDEAAKYSRVSECESFMNIFRSIKQQTTKEIY